MNRARQYFFIHVMKTAGGTLRQQILANFERGEVYPFKELDPDMRDANYRIDYLVGLPPERRERIRVFTGHFPYVAVQLLGMELTTLTILRDPIERTLSYLRHCKQLHPQHRDLALEEIYEDPFFFPAFIKDHQAKLFAFSVHDRPESYMDALEVDSTRLARAKENLERIDVVGVQERFDELLREVQSRFGWRIMQQTKTRNATGTAGVSAAFRRRIAEDNRADMEFYEHACGICSRRRRVGAAV
jgi:hypothetical protein